MKNISVKNMLLALTQVPVALVLWAVVYIELRLTKLLDYLANPLLSPRARTVLERIVNSRTTKDTRIFAVLDLLDERDNNCQLNNDRKIFEKTETGCTLVASHPDRHLYSVLQPTKAENLKRIENVLQVMSPADLRRVYRNARKLMQIFA